MDEKVIVRDQCVCGRRYRVRHPHVGFTFACPQCHRSITITRADIEIAEPDVGDAPVFHEDPEERVLLEAIPIGDDIVRLADHGAGKGPTGRVEYETGEAAVLGALGGIPLLNDESDIEDAPRSKLRPTTAPIERQRTFLEDLCASSYLAGEPGNLVKLGVTAAGCAVTWAFGQLWISALGNFPGVFMFGMLLYAVAGIAVAMYVLQLFWQIVGETASGEDVFSWAPSNWDLWNNLLQPVGWLLTITILCGTPLWAVTAWCPPIYPVKLLAQAAALLIGSLFWPVAVMSVSIGQSILFVRPDWLIRCIIGIGPVYVLPWVLVLAMFAAWGAFLGFNPPVDQFGMAALLVYLTAYPLAACLWHMFFGYVTFRTMGLLYRHFSKRFPWDL